MGHKLGRDLLGRRRGGIGDALWLGFRLGQQFGQVLPARFGPYRDQQRDGTKGRDRDEGGVHIKGHALEQGACGCIGGIGADQHGQAIWCGAGHGFRPDQPIGAGAVFHHHILAEGIAHFLGKNARDRIGGRAGGEGHNGAHRAGRPILRGGKAWR